ncbi:squalene/phytoene synthase family protein, partial [Akkermansiaceae bacterium]|nr:squalene/phytoene synthase family protein [Akkermansiaceae bacterium]
MSTRVLKDVSRSFYLSLRFLPPGFRAPASLGYLLARLSDTIADAGGASPEERKVLLTEFRESMETGSRDWLEGLSGLTGLSEGEERLVQRAG